jgi:predicted small lipoprotein YifL
MSPSRRGEGALCPAEAPRYTAAPPATVSWKRTVHRRLALAAGLAVLASGCGQKGPLYYVPPEKLEELEREREKRRRSGRAPRALPATRAPA